jgi:alkanesulfonate monooxygenase SsuD/methylene tetrahydromethanopterin reductase-like flavin-dependent oxidoreductase (luciferase family)
MVPNDSMSRARPRIAVSIMPLETRRDVVTGLAVAADRHGYDAFLLPETWTFDICVLLAEVALKTSRIGIGTGILGVWNRTPATIAMAASTLHAQSGGRFVLGLGASTPQLVEGLHDVPFTAPLGRLRRTVVQVRALLRGERVPLAVTTEARSLRLNLPPAPDLPIYLAALGEQSIRLAGELGDGWMPFLYPLGLLDEARRLLGEGAARGGHPDRLPLICPSLPTVVAPEAAKAREGAAWFASFYLVSMGTFYRESLKRQGFAKEVEAVMAANTPKFAGLVPPEADVLLEELMVFGTPEEARRRLQRWFGAGAHMAGLLLRPNMAPEEIEFTLAAFRPMLG